MWCQSLAVSFRLVTVCATVCTTGILHSLREHFAKCWWHTFSQLLSTIFPYLQLECTSNVYVYVCYPRSEDPISLNFLYTILKIICSDMLFRQRHVTSKQEKNLREAARFMGPATFTSLTSLLVCLFTTKSLYTTKAEATIAWVLPQNHKVE